MPGDAWRLTDIVTVPDVMGLPMEEARKVASAAGVVLTQPDADGPPLAALTWPGDFLVTGQTPGVGTRLWRWDSVVVSWRAMNGGDWGRCAGTSASDTAPGHIRSTAAGGRDRDWLVPPRLIHTRRGASHKPNVLRERCRWPGYMLPNRPVTPAR